MYDCVFKSIMKDERIAKTIFSALLKKEVTHVTVRPHEYSPRNTPSMFRMDFTATLREDDEHEDRIVQIALHKTWLGTDTLRCRQYLGAQYYNNTHKHEDDEKAPTYPSVAIYFLNHRIGHTHAPVIYLHHDAVDYNGEIIEGGTEEPLVKSLQPNSIIVQIPLLQGPIHNRLEKVLSVFHQSQAGGDTQQILHIDEAKYTDDEDLLYILYRLTAAAADPEMREDMNAEDIYYPPIEERDTVIMQREERLKAQEKLLSQQNTQLRNLAKALYDKGVTIEQISAIAAIPAEKVATLIL